MQGVQGGVVPDGIVGTLLSARFQEGQLNGASQEITC